MAAPVQPACACFRHDMRRSSVKRAHPRNKAALMRDHTNIFG